jgi:hypothetical protein
MASVASQLIEEVTAHGQRDSLEDAREVCANGTYFPNNLRTLLIWVHRLYKKWQGYTVYLQYLLSGPVLVTLLGSNSQTWLHQNPSSAITSSSRVISLFEKYMLPLRLIKHLTMKTYGEAMCNLIHTYTRLVEWLVVVLSSFSKV